MNRVLIINDSRFERLFLKDVVATLGFEAYATDEFGSLRQVDNLQPEMVIVNYTMSGMTGDKLVKSIKEKYPQVKCLLSSCSELDPRKFPRVDGIVHTPVERDHLQDLLQRLLVTQESRSSVEAAEEIHYQYCPYCGQELPGTGNKMAFCPFCGHKIEQ